MRHLVFVLATAVVLIVTVQAKGSVKCPSVPDIQCFAQGPVYCNTDDDCTGNAKCCTMACGGKACVHPGACPLTRLTMVRCLEAVDDCTTDADCKPNEKCCSHVCGKKCQRAEHNSAVHQGKCPKLQKDTFGTCVNYCTTDDDCESNKKCCSNGCGHTCQGAVGN